MPHGSPLFSRFFSMPAASTGNADSISTWWRRIPSMWSMCSMSTGHSSTHAPQFVHDQSTSGSMTPPSLPTRGRSASALTASGSFSRSSSEAASRYGALAKAWSRRSRMTCLGDSGLPVAQAGHCDWHRPHSVQVAMSSRPFQVKSSILPRPNTSVSGSASSKSSTLPLLRIGSSGAQGVRAAGEQDVQRGQRDVQVLGVDHDHRERHDHAELGQQEHHLQHAVDPGAQRVQDLRHDPRREGPGVRVGEDAGVDAARRGTAARSAMTTEDHAQHDPGGAGVRAEEP